MNVLLVEDDNEHAELIQRTLRRSLADEPSVTVLRAPTGHRALLLLEQRPVELILLDYSLPDRTGLEVLDAIRKTRNVDVPVIFLTAADSAEVCARAFKAGVIDYVVKKLNYLELLPGVISSARGAIAARAAGTVDALPGMVGESPAAITLKAAVTRAGQSSSTVLIEGETGTGKELVAREIHAKSIRAKKPLVFVNCAAIPEALFESELFGCVRGAYTGAMTDRIGMFESANGGSLMLDEIEALPLTAQAKLLRVLQEREFRPLGSPRVQRVDVRVLAATNESLERMVEQGRFRRDLFYRLDVVRIHVPPLRERREDVARLARHFIATFNQRNRTRFGKLSDDALAALAGRPWPGNIRELENVIERTLVNSTDPVIDETGLLEAPSGIETSSPDERQHLLEALTRNRWNREQTARELGLSRVTLWRKMTRYRLHD